MGKLTVKIPRLGMQTALVVATLLNIKPVLAQNHQSEARNSTPVGTQIEAPVLMESEKIEPLKSQKLSDRAADLLPSGNTSGFLTPTNITTANPEVLAQDVPSSKPVRFNRWSFSAEALFLNRSIPGDIETSEIYDINTAEDGETLGTDNLDFNYELGTRITLGYRLAGIQRISHFESPSTWIAKSDYCSICFGRNPSISSF
jgi:hypothetical protein